MQNDLTTTIAGDAIKNILQCSVAIFQWSATNLRRLWFSNVPIRNTAFPSASCVMELNSVKMAVTKTTMSALESFT